MAQSVGPNPYADGLFHTYGVLWTPTQIKFYCDDVQMGDTITNPFGNSPNRNCLVLTDAKIGGFGGHPNGSTTFPLVAKIDYIAVYQLARQPASVLK